MGQLQCIDKDNKIEKKIRKTKEKYQFTRWAK